MSKTKAEVADLKVMVQQVRSGAGRQKKVKDTLRALGLGRIGDMSELPATDAVLGMVKKVEHLVKVSSVN